MCIRDRRSARHRGRPSAPPTRASALRRFASPRPARHRGRPSAPPTRASALRRAASTTSRSAFSVGHA
eukprot:6379257-Prymnesium_polylepis.1